MPREAKAAEPKKRGPGRPAQTEGEVRQQISVRLSPSVIEFFRATGNASAAINDVLARHIRRTRKG